MEFTFMVKVRTVIILGNLQILLNLKLCYNQAISFIKKRMLQQPARENYLLIMQPLNGTKLKATIINYDFCSLRAEANERAHKHGYG